MLEDVLTAGKQGGRKGEERGREGGNRERKGKCTMCLSIKVAIYIALIII